MLLVLILPYMGLSPKYHTQCSKILKSLVGNIYIHNYIIMAEKKTGFKFSPLIRGSKWGKGPLYSLPYSVRLHIYTPSTDEAHGSAWTSHDCWRVT